MKRNNTAKKALYKVSYSFDRFGNDFCEKDVYSEEELDAWTTMFKYNKLIKRYRAKAL